MDELACQHRFLQEEKEAHREFGMLFLGLSHFLGSYFTGKALCRTAKGSSCFLWSCQMSGIGILDPPSVLPVKETEPRGKDSKPT